MKEKESSIKGQKAISEEGIQFMEELRRNRKNILADFADKESIVLAIKTALRAPKDKAYIVVDHFVVSSAIAGKLNLDNDLALLIPINHLSGMGNGGGVNGEMVYQGILIASRSPEYILFDKRRGNFRFVVEIGNKRHRVVLSFSVIPKYQKDVVANILESIFRDGRRNYEKYIQEIKNNPASEIAFVYGDEEGWTSSADLSLILQQEGLIHRARGSWTRGGSQGNSNAAPHTDIIREDGSKEQCAEAPSGQKG